MPTPERFMNAPLSQLPASKYPTLGRRNEPTDEALVAAARNGVVNARELLFLRHLPWTRRFAFKLLGSDQDLNDVVQDSMLNALEAFGRLRDPRFFSSWLGGVVVNTVRGARRQRQRAVANGTKAEDIALFPSLESHAVAPDVALELSSVLRVLAPLPELQRQAWALRYVAENSLDEIARMLGRSPVTVKRWLRKADARVATLRRC